MDIQEIIEETSENEKYDDFSDESSFDSDSSNPSLEDHSEGTLKVNVFGKTFQELSELRICQELREHKKAVWALKFSPDGEYLASAGADGVICIWRVRTEMFGKDSRSDFMHVFEEIPLRKYSGHTSHIVDLAWSKSGFLLSASLDCTVRLWHINDPSCLCQFRHKDMVTSVDFFPEEESYFVSGSMDRKLRIWSIPQGCVLKWVQAPAIISTVTFCPGGRLCAAGLLDGQVIFYYSDGLRYFTQAECRNHRGKDKRGRKVTGITFVDRSEGQCMVVTTNDSRIRLISMDTFGLISKYKGHSNRSRQFRASISTSEKYIVCGSDDDRIFLWRTACDLGVKPAVVRDGVTHYEAFESFHCCLEHEKLSCVTIVPDNAIQNCKPGQIEEMNEIIQEYKKKNNVTEDINSCFIFLAGTMEGNIHVFSSFALPKKV